MSTDRSCTLLNQVAASLHSKRPLATMSLACMCPRTHIKVALSMSYWPEDAFGAGLGALPCSSSAHSAAFFLKDVLAVAVRNSARRLRQAPFSLVEIPSMLWLTSAYTNDSVSVSHMHVVARQRGLTCHAMQTRQDEAE